MQLKQLKNMVVQFGVVVTLLIVSCVLDAHGRTVKKTDFSYNQKMAVDVKQLGQLAGDTAQFLSNVHKSSYVQVDQGNIFKELVTFQDVKDTIDFLAETAKKDPKKLNSLWFYTHYFDFYRLYSDGEHCAAKIGKLPRGWKGAPEEHRITSYRICKIGGSHTKTKQYTFPLYPRPTDEVGKTPAHIADHPAEYVRYKHTRPEIVNGILEKKGVLKPTAWVTLEGYKELVMQGSALIDFGDSTQLFQAVVDNGKKGADNYWFTMPYEKRASSKKYPIKVEPIPGVSFAGNIPELGFGKVLVMIGKNPLTLEPEMKVGILTDTGRAFEDNVCKFDLFTGYFENHHLFSEHCKQYPHTAQIYVIIKKRKTTKGQK